MDSKVVAVEHKGPPAHLLRQLLDVLAVTWAINSLVADLQVDKASFGRNGCVGCNVLQHQLVLVDGDVGSGATPAFLGDTFLAESSLVLEQDFHSTGFSFSEGLQDCLSLFNVFDCNFVRNSLALAHSFVLDATFEVKSAQRSGCNLLVHELAVKEHASVLESEARPNPKGMLTGKKLNVLLLKVPLTGLLLPLLLRYGLVLADVLDCVVREVKCL